MTFEVGDRVRHARDTYRLGSVSKTNEFGSTVEWDDEYFGTYPDSHIVKEPTPIDTYKDPRTTDPQYLVKWEGGYCSGPFTHVELESELFEHSAEEYKVFEIAREVNVKFKIEIEE